MGGWLLVEIGDVERPEQALRELLAEFGVDATPETMTANELDSDSSHYKTTHGRTAGFTVDGGESPFGGGMEIVTFGTTAIEVHWTLSHPGMSLPYASSEFRVRFDDDADRERFAVWWHARFGRRPALREK